MIGRRERSEALVDRRHQLVGDEGAPLRIARVFFLPIGGLREHRDHRRNRLVRDQVVEHFRHVHLLDVVRAVEDVHHRVERVRRRPHNRAAGRTRPAACPPSERESNDSAISSPFGADPSSSTSGCATKNGIRTSDRGPANACTVRWFIGSARVFLVEQESILEARVRVRRALEVRPRRAFDPRRSCRSPRRSPAASRPSR